MLGPFPAEYTPLLPGGNPIHSFRIALAVALPTPAGKASSQKRNRHPSERANLSSSVGLTSSACPTKHVCSVSSLTIPRPSTNECRKGGPSNIRSARRRESISRGRPRESPTAVPMIAPGIFCSCSANCLIPMLHLARKQAHYVGFQESSALLLRQIALVNPFPLLLFIASFEENVVVRFLSLNLDSLRNILGRGLALLSIR